MSNIHSQTAAELKTFTLNIVLVLSIPAFTDTQSGVGDEMKLILSQPQCQSLTRLEHRG